MKEKKSIIIFGIILLIIVIIVSLIFIFRDNSKGVIKLETHENGIYEWKYEIKNKKIVRFDKKEKLGDSEDKNGGLILERYTFKALKPGKTTIKFTFINTKNGSYDEIKKYGVVVDKKLNINITEKK